MIKKTTTMALVVALTGGLIYSNSTVANSETLASKEAAINQSVVLPYGSSAFLKQTEEFVLKKIEEKRLAEEKRQREMEEALRLEQERIVQENNRKNSIDFNYYDVTSDSNITAEELYTVLSAFSGGALAQYAWAIVDCEEIYDVNSFFLAAIIAQESSWGKSDRAIYQNNLTGHAVYDSNAAGTSFSDPAECIYITAELLATDYLDPNVASFNGYAVNEVNMRYCLKEDRQTVDYGWSESINSIANSFVKEYHNEVKVLE